jgi:hypothetical protein
MLVEGPTSLLGRYRRFWDSNTTAKDDDARV